MLARLRDPETWVHSRVRALLKTLKWAVIGFFISAFVYVFMALVLFDDMFDFLVELLPIGYFGPYFLCALVLGLVGMVASGVIFGFGLLGLVCALISGDIGGGSNEGISEATLDSASDLVESDGVVCVSVSDMADENDES